MSTFVDPGYRRTQIALACAGSVDSGKSSLIGCLTYNVLDDGKGSSRNLVCKHPHEQQSGKTSDISTRVCDLDNNTSLTFVDLCGHEKYFKTTNFGLSGYFPDYAFLIVSANRGMLQMTKQHLRLLLTYNIPFCIVITHIDIAPDEIYEKTRNDLTKILKKMGGVRTSTKFVNHVDDFKKSPEEVQKIEDSAIETILEHVIDIPYGKQMCYPVVSMSNKTGAFLQVLKRLLVRLTPRSFWTPGGEEAVTQNKIVKQLNNSLERQLAIYKEAKLEEYMKTLSLDNENIDQLQKDFEKQLLENNSQLLSNCIPKYTDFTGGVFYVDSCYNPPGIGTVITGITRGKSIKPSDTIHIGPFGKQFYDIRVKSLHNNVRQLIPSLEDHDRGCIAFVPLKKADIQKKHIRKGIIAITSLDLVKNICFRFKAIVRLFDCSVTMKTGTTPVIHLNTIAQPARMIIDPSENGGKNVLCFDGKTTSVAIVTFKFKLRPEYVEPYNLFVLRSGDIQGLGMVINVLSINDDTDAVADPIKAKRRTYYKRNVKSQGNEKSK